MAWEFELLDGPWGGITEGPAWDGQALLFTNIHPGRIMRYEPASGSMTVYHPETNFTNGLNFDTEGRLYGCCSGGRSIVRFEPDGSMTTIVDRVGGQRLNTPNDLAIDGKNRIWFTNPWNAVNVDASEAQEVDHKSVLRADPQPDGSWTCTRVTFDTTMPNGILVSPDQSTLYVAESDSDPGGIRELRGYPINDDGSLGPYAVLHTFGEDHRGPQRGIDGMCFDSEGNIVATAGWSLSGPGAMIYVFAPSGQVLESHLVPEGVDRPTNCAFGDSDLSTLYVTTAEGHFFRCRNSGRTGWAIWP